VTFFLAFYLASVLTYFLAYMLTFFLASILTFFLAGVQVQACSPASRACDRVWVRCAQLPPELAMHSSDEVAEMET